jgi:hypothetical protein
MTVNRITVAMATALALAAASSVAGQTKIGPAPSGSPKQVAAAAIKDADHPCGSVVRATRLDTGGIRAVCSNGEAYRVFTVDRKVVAMRCSAAARLGVSGC